MKQKTKTTSIIVIIIIVIVILGLLFGFDLNLFSVIEPARGQVTWDDFNINPCRIVTESEVRGFFNRVGVSPEMAVEYVEKTTIQLPKCIILTYGVPPPTIENGKLNLNAGEQGTTFIITEDFSDREISVYYEMVTLDTTSAGMTMTTSYGGKDILLGDSIVKKGVIKFYHSFLDPEITYLNIEGRQEQATPTRYFSVNVRGNAKYGRPILRIDEIRYSKPNTQCIAKEDEQIQYDDFGPGAEIRWVEPRTLSFEPIRFCYNLPVQRRSLTSGGIGTPDLDAELVSLLAEGKSYIVKSDEIITVPYLYKIIAGEESKCKKEFGEVIGRDNGCIVYFRENNVKCQKNEDCIFIEDCTSKCISNICVYNSNECKRKALIRQDIMNNIKESIEVLPLTENEFRFSFSHELINFFNIGREPIYHSVFYSGINENGKDMYSINIEAFKKKIVNEGQLNPYLYVKGCNAIGSIKYKVYGAIPTKYNAYCDYKIDTSFLTIREGEGFKDYELGSDGKMLVIVSNSLIDLTNAGYELRCRRIAVGLQEQLPTRVVDYEYVQGDTIVNIDIETSKLGQVICEFTPYFKVNADREYIFTGKNIYTFTYTINEKPIPTTTTTIPSVTTTTTIPIEPPTPKKFPIFPLLGGIIFVLILYSIYYFKFRKK